MNIFITYTVLFAILLSIYGRFAFMLRIYIYMGETANGV